MNLVSVYNDNDLREYILKCSVQKGAFGIQKLSRGNLCIKELSLAGRQTQKWVMITAVIIKKCTEHKAGSNSF